MVLLKAGDELKNNLAARFADLGSESPLEDADEVDITALADELWIYGSTIAWKNTVGLRCFRRYTRRPSKGLSKISKRSKKLRPIP